MAERLLLVGMMGSGKSTAGRLAAQQLGWTWVDTDAEITKASGIPVPEFFARHGEAHFRREEGRILEAVLRRDESLVISVGGGAVLDPTNRQAIRDAGTVVWLRARPQTLIERVRDGVGRPLLAGASPEDRAATIRRIEAERRPLYAEVAHDIVDVDGIRAHKVADHLVRCVGQGASGRQASS